MGVNAGSMLQKNLECKMGFSYKIFLRLEICVNSQTKDASDKIKYWSLPEYIKNGTFNAQQTINSKAHDLGSNHLL